LSAEGNPGFGRSADVLDTGVTDGLATAVVLVVGSHIAQALMQTDRVVVHANPVEFGFEVAEVGDEVQVRELVLDIAEERLDPGLIVGVAGRPMWRAMRTEAMNMAVAFDVICGPLSDIASSAGTS
jgi:hypothetical protein